MLNLIAATIVGAFLLALLAAAAAVPVLVFKAICGIYRVSTSPNPPAHRYSPGNYGRFATGEVARAAPYQQFQHRPVYTNGTPV